MSMPEHGRDGGEVEALRTDRYLESLLVAWSRGGVDAPAIDVDPDVRRAASRLARDLPRLHPSFRFEERLAGRLADLAASMRPAVIDDADRTVVHLPGPTTPAGLDDSALLDGEPLGGLRADLVRPLVIGGALTSAAISIAGAAIVVWRRGRTSSSPMARAARAVARNRLA
jgi:hypothetical protein